MAAPSPMAPKKRATKSRTKTATRPAKRATAKRAAAAKGPPLLKEGQIAHVELYSDAPEATKQFYTDVFGWKFSTASYGPGMEYNMFQAAAAPHGGLMSRQGMPPTLPATLVYVNVKDLDRTVRDIENAGGKIYQRMEVPNVGWFAIFEAPGGIVQAAWQENPKFRSAGTR